MLYATHNVSARTFLKLAVLLPLLLVGGLRAAFAAPPPIVPQLIPYNNNWVAGQYDVSGYGGDNNISTSSTINAPQTVAIDAAGNVYFGDYPNDVIREINAQTGFITTVAGVDPVNCTGTTCATKTSGCADGVPALGNPIGSAVVSVALDAYGNLYFVDTTSDTVSVIYRGGAQVANFISLVNNTAAPTPASVKVGYVYHVAGTINLTTCGGTPTQINAAKGTLTTSNTSWNCTGSGAVPACTGTNSINYIGDNQLPFTNNAGAPTTFGTTFNSLNAVSLDSAGNIWLQDAGNDIIRVINTQSAPQSFFLTTSAPSGVTLTPLNSSPVPPGFIRSIVNCSPYTVNCPAYALTEQGTGNNEPAEWANYSGGIPTGQESMAVDAYGNVLEENSKGSLSNLFQIAIAYAGGSVTANMIANANNGNSTASGATTAYVAGLAGTPATVGDWYWLTQNETIRPSSAFFDKAGNMYYYDNHYPQLFRFDAYAQPNTGNFLNYSGVTEGGTAPGNNHARIDSSIGPGTPYPCYPNGTSTSPIATITAASFSQYFTTNQGDGLGCPAALTYSGGSGAGVPDGAGNVWVADKSDDLISKIQPNNQFPAVPITLTGSTTNASPIVNVSSTAGLAIGMVLTGPGIPAGDNIYTIGVGTVTLWQPATATASNVVLTPSVVQSIEIHFDHLNLPALVANSKFANTASGISIVSAIPDFTISLNETQFTIAGTAYAEIASNQVSASTSGGAQLQGNPICTNTEAQNGGNFDCLVNVVFQPTAPGLRQAELSVITSFTGGSTPVTETYNFGLTGFGLGGALAIDGGAQTSAFTSTKASVPAVAIAPTGAMYIADPGNNQIVVCPPVSSGACTAPTTITTVLGTALKAPMGVAVDAAGNVYISDTGNNRIVEVTPITGAQALLGQILAASTAPQFGPAYTQYAFKSPEGIAVDINGNVYVADTGNKKVVYIPNNPVLGGATPLMNFPGAPVTFSNPVAVAVDKNNNLYVADTTFPAIVEIAPGGGDLNGLSSGGIVNNPYLGAGFINGSPNGVAVDGAGNVYISDTGTGAGTAVVTVIPTAGSPTGIPYSLSYTGVSVPAGLAIDQGGNVYLADSGTGLVLYEGRQSPTVNFSTVPEDLTLPTLPPCPTSSNAGGAYCVITVTNTGTQPITVNEPFATLSGSSAFSIVEPGVNSNTGLTNSNPGINPSAIATLCSALQGQSGGSPLLAAGGNCSIVVSFDPTSVGQQTATVSLNNGAESFALVANGGEPLATLALALTAPTSTSTQYTPSNNSTSGVAGSAITVKATVTQTYVSGVTPGGTVSFSYTVDGVAASAAPPCTTPTCAIALSGGTASFTIPASAVLQGHQYIVTATYSGDASDTAPAAQTFVIQVAGEGVTATATPITFVYGSTPPAITGTVTGIPSGDVATLKYAFSTPATATTSPGTYPINVTFSGATDAASYGSGSYPPVYATGSTTTLATATVTKAALSVVVNSATTVYGALPVNLSSSVSPLKLFTETFSLGGGGGDSQVLNVGTYAITDTLSGDKSVDYNATVTPGKLTITPGTSQISIGEPANATGNSALGAAVDYILGLGTLGSTTYTINATTANLQAAAYTISVSTSVGGGIGIPTGNAYVSDTFIPFTNSGSGLGTAVPGCTPTVTSNCTALYKVPLVSGVGTFYPVIPSPAPANINTVGFLAGIAPGLHMLTVYYTATPTSAGTAGDSNFLASNTAAAPVALVVANPGASTTLPWPAVTGDFVVQAESLVSGTLTTAPVQVNPGTLPSTTSGEAQVTVTPYLAYVGTVYLTCAPQSPAYVTCTVAPTTVTAASSTTGVQTAVTTTVSISTPATEPVGFNLGAGGGIALILPLGLFALCVRRRRNLSNALWVLMAVAIVSVGMVGCADNNVHFYTPIPAGPQTVTIYACTAPASCPVTGATGAGPTGSSTSTQAGINSIGLIRSYPLLINIQ